MSKKSLRIKMGSIVFIILLILAGFIPIIGGYSQKVETENVNNISRFIIRKRCLCTIKMN